MGGSDPKAVQCRRHGETRPAYACAHSLASLKDGDARGLNYVRDEDGFYNGWCSECDRFLLAHGGAWNDETEGFAQIRLLCEGCFDQLIAMNGASGP